MPLIRCDYSKDHLDAEGVRKMIATLFDTTAEIWNYNEEDAQNQISVFSVPYGEFDHSTAAAEVEVRAKMTEFDRPSQTRAEVRAEWLKRYEAVLVPFAQQQGLAAPIIFTITFEDWEVVVVSSAGSKPN